jgi:hypothetical protein
MELYLDPNKLLIGIDQVFSIKIGFALRPLFLFLECDDPLLHGSCIVRMLRLTAWERLSFMLESGSTAVMPVLFQHST